MDCSVMGGGWAFDHRDRIAWPGCVGHCARCVVPDEVLSAILSPMA
jgi:hypothetical protein